VARHPFDLTAFVFGLVITGLAAAYIVGAYTDIRLDPRLALPLILVGLGAIGLAASLVAQRRNDRWVQG